MICTCTCEFLSRMAKSFPSTKLLRWGWAKEGGSTKTGPRRLNFHIFSFPMEVKFSLFLCSSQFLSLFPLFFQACPAQPLWTTNGVDPRGTARPATSTGDRDYLGIVGQCGDSASPHNVCKTELFSKQSVLAHIKCLRNLLPGLQMRCEEKGLHTGVTLVD